MDNGSGPADARASQAGGWRRGDQQALAPPRRLRARPLEALSDSAGACGPNRSPPAQAGSTFAQFVS